MTWARGIAKEHNYKIINTGDFLDSDKIEAEVGYLVSNIYKDNTIEENLLLGNHEMKDSGAKYTSLNILKPYPNLNIIDKLKVEEVEPGIFFIYQPFTKNPDDIKTLCDTLDKIKGKKILFSHLTYVNVPNVYLNNKIKGDIDYNMIKNRVDLIFNGHIHVGLESDKYVQIGTLTGSTFGDNYSFHKPGIIIFDTKDLTFERIENPYAILYINATYDEFKTKFNKKDTEQNRIRLCVECPAGKVEELKKKLDKLDLLSYKIKIISQPKENNDGEKTDFNLYTDPSQALYDFVKTEKGVYTEKQLDDFIKEYIEGNKTSV